MQNNNNNKHHTRYTELIWFHRNKHPAHPLNNQCLQLDPNCIITPVNTVRDLGVLLDSSLNLKAHITSVTRSCFFHLRHIRQVKKCLNERCLRVLVQALVISRIDYCNSILTGLPAVTIHPLTTVLHAAARIIKDILIEITSHPLCEIYTGFPSRHE